MTVASCSHPDSLKRNCFYQFLLIYKKIRFSYLTKKVLCSILHYSKNNQDNPASTFIHIHHSYVTNFVPFTARYRLQFLSGKGDLASHSTNRSLDDLSV